MLARQIQEAAIPPDPDGRVILHGMGWWQFEAMLAIRGDQAGVRLAYLEGALEIMSPSTTHEIIKTMIARLLEAYAEERGILFNGYGSLTMKNAPKERGAEPDECYVVGSKKADPDLVIEVIWTSGGLDKRRLYAGLGVRELWEWRRGKITVYGLRDGAYLALERSELLPDLDLDLLTSFLETDDQTASVRAFRAALRQREGRT
jgi:Uma2 family endonuclease